MMREMRHETILRHPIIVDSSTGLILDGTHRSATLRALGFEYVPVAEIDYRNPLVTLSRWYRIIDGQKLGSFLSEIQDFHPERVDRELADEMLKQRKTFATLHDLNETIIFPTNTSEGLEHSRLGFKIEQIARKRGLTINYADVPQLDHSLPDRFVLSGIQVTKDEVVDVTHRNMLYPPKTTRHLIPSRPLSTRTPFEWLRNTRDHVEAEDLFIRQLEKKTVRRLAPGTWVGSRRYQEEVFLFE